MTASALAGCGGSDADSDPEQPTGTAAQPTPNEPIASKMEELNAAVAQESCRRYVPLVYSFSRAGLRLGEPPTKAECRVFESGVLEDLRGTHFVDNAEFGTAAVIEGPAGNGDASTRTTAWVVDRDGEYRIADAFAGPPQIGSEPGSEDPGEAAETFVEAVVEGDCARLTSVLNSGGRLARDATGEAAACEAILDGKVFAPAIRETPDPQPVELGATANLAFYGVPTEGAYFTLVLSDAGEASGDMTVRDVLPNTPVPLPEPEESAGSRDGG